MINVVVVDDHAGFREGLRALLARVADITVVGEASNTDEAVAVTADAQPDVVLMDLNLPGGGGEVATRRILATRPETAVLVLTMHADGGHLQQALGAGARGYLLKDGGELQYGPQRRSALRCPITPPYGDPGSVQLITIGETSYPYRLCFVLPPNRWHDVVFELQIDAGTHEPAVFAGGL